MKKKFFNVKVWALGLMIAGTQGFYACATSPSESAITATVEAAPVEEVVAVVEQTPEQVAPAASDSAKPAMVFDSKEFHFGEIVQGDKVEYTFKFKNTGTAPLIISNVRASCGCTVPQWPKEAIAPGAEGQIHVVFNSRGKSGNQNKSVRISTNISETPEVIYLKGNVTLPVTPTTGN